MLGAVLFMAFPTTLTIYLDKFYYNKKKPAAPPPPVQKTEDEIEVELEDVPPQPRKSAAKVALEKSARPSRQTNTLPDEEQPGKKKSKGVALSYSSGEGSTSGYYYYSSTEGSTNN
jgi:hypothetical protein